MSDKAQLAALGAHLEQQRSISTVYRAEGKRLAVAEVECIAIGGRVYRAAEVIAIVQEHERIEAPLTLAEIVEGMEADTRMAARREVVKAALAWYDAENEATAEHVTAPNSDAEYRAAARAIQASKALYDAARSFREAGGSEVTG